MKQPAELRFRPYVAADRDICTRLFDSNVPAFFAATEREEFLTFLDNLPGPYIVMEQNGHAAGCGGWALHPQRSEAAILCWGMIEGSRHRMGLGAELLAARIRSISTNLAIHAITLNTSQHSLPFFERFGFKTLKRLPDGYAPGIDMIEMWKDINAPESC